MLGTGGTIASRRDAALDAVVSVAKGTELLAGLGSLAPDVDVTAEQFCNVGSYLLDLETSFALARRCATILESDDVAGVVVTHGTDTMEESAFLADLTVASDKPIVFTGAQRNAEEPDRDGPRNLADAIRLAASPQARGLGTMIQFEGEFHAARDATKIHASRVGTFASHEHGKLGEVDAGQVMLHRRPVARHVFAAPGVETRVDLIRLVLGADDRFIRFAMESGARGIVLEAFGRGNGAAGTSEAVRAAVARGIAVLVTSRCPQGRVMPVYGNGGGKDLAGAGAVFAGDLSGIKARILLSVLLATPGIDLREAVERVGC